MSLSRGEDSTADLRVEARPVAPLSAQRRVPSTSPILRSAKKTCREFVQPVAAASCWATALCASAGARKMNGVSRIARIFRLIAEDFFPGNRIICSLY